MALDDDLAGGFSNYYNPSFGLMAIQQPEMFVQHLASKGIQPPADFPADFSHQDAHQMMARNDAPQMPEQLTSPTQRRAWQNLSPSQQRNVSEYWKSGDPSALDRSSRPMNPAPTPPQPPVPEPGTTRYNFQPATGPGQSVTLPNRDNPSPQGGAMPYTDDSRSMNDSSGGSFGNWIKNLFPSYGKPPPDTGTAPTPNPDAPFAVPVAPPLPSLSTTDMKPVPSTPLPTPRPPNAPEPTPPSDAPNTAGGAPISEGSSPTQPGRLNTEDPNAKAAADAADRKKAKSGDSQDSFGKALAGLSAMKPPTPVLPHPGPLPHQANQISRSTLPTELLKEVSQMGRHSHNLTLGKALRGG